MDNVLKIRIEEVAKKKILFLPHTIQQMSRPERIITATEVKNVIFEGEIIENYPNDLRGAKNPSDAIA